MDDNAHTAPHIVHRSGESVQGPASSHHPNRYLLMHSLWHGLLMLHGHVVESRRTLRWADPSAWEARQDTERTNASGNHTADSAQPRRISSHEISKDVSIRASDRSFGPRSRRLGVR